MRKNAKDARLRACVLPEVCKIKGRNVSWCGMSGALSSRQCTAQQSRVRDDIQMYRQPARSYPECAWKAHARGTVAATLMCDGAVKTDF